MIKKLIVLCILLSAPVIAEELSFQSEAVNMTPSSSFSGFKSNNTYTQSNNKMYQFTDMNEQRRNIMKAKSVTEMGNIQPRNTSNVPMNYGQFPHNYDSSNMMHIQSIQNGMQNMYMGF